MIYTASNGKHAIVRYLYNEGIRIDFPSQGTDAKIITDLYVSVALTTLTGYTNDYHNLGILVGQQPLPDSYIAPIATINQLPRLDFCVVKPLIRNVTTQSDFYPIYIEKIIINTPSYMLITPIQLVPQPENFLFSISFTLSNLETKELPENWKHYV